MYKAWSILAGVAVLVLVSAAQEKHDAAPGPDFVRDIQPIFAANCYNCHGPKLQMAKLRLDARTTAFTGGQSGKVILPGNAAGSILYQRIAGLGESARMPMGGKPLPAESIALIREWINHGANWPDGVGASVAEVKTHWGFVAPVRPPIPVVKAGWARNSIDDFILARLEKESLAPSPEADRVTLLRRLSLDLIGLAAHPRRNRRLSCRQEPRMLTKSRWIACSLRRTTANAGRRIGWTPPATPIPTVMKKTSPAQRLVLSRLGDRRFNQRSALQPVRHRANRRRSAAPATQDQIVATGFLRNS